MGQCQTSLPQFHADERATERVVLFLQVFGTEPVSARILQIRLPLQLKLRQIVFGRAQGRAFQHLSRPGQPPPEMPVQSALAVRSQQYCSFIQVEIAPPTPHQPALQHAQQIATSQPVLLIVVSLFRENCRPYLLPIRLGFASDHGMVQGFVELGQVLAEVVNGRAQPAAGLFPIGGAESAEHIG
jgi:hypothetical protein